jgi:hypothetical protein
MTLRQQKLIEELMLIARDQRTYPLSRYFGEQARACKYRWLSLEKSWLKYSNGKLQSSLKCFWELTYHYY